MPAAHERIHATAIAFGDAAVLIRGASGSGKSDLALRCLACPASALLPHTVRLVADDQVLLTRQGDRLIAAAPEVLRGLIEVRGVGILPVPAISHATVRLVADLVQGGTIERLPETSNTVTLSGVAVPHLLIAPFEHSSHIKLLLALSRL